MTPSSCGIMMDNRKHGNSVFYKSFSDLLNHKYFGHETRATNGYNYLQYF